MKSISVEENLSRVTQLITDKQYAAAADLCTALIAQSPQNATAHYLAGLACYLSNRPERAVDYFRQAVFLNSADKNALYNLGVVCGELHRNDEAISAYRALIEQAPRHTKAYQNMALLLVKTGKYTESVATLKQVLDADPADILTAGLLLEIECQWLPMPARILSCNDILRRAELTDEIRYTGLIYRAMAEWIIEDDQALAGTLAMALRHKPSTLTTGVRNIGIFETFLTRLLEYRHVDPALYVTNKKTLCMVGDSHSLSYAGANIRFEGDDYKINSHIIVGTKSWHIGTAPPNSRAQALAAYMARLPVGSTFFCVFGEIDCRLDNGILPAWQKYGGALEALVDTQVSAYVRAVTASAALRSLRPVFVSVPAPHRASGDRRHVVTLYNAALARHARQSGHRYFDLYTPTLGADGFSDESLYLDKFHLKPHVISGK